VSEGRLEADAHRVKVSAHHSEASAALPRTRALLYVRHVLLLAALLIRVQEVHLIRLLHLSVRLHVVLSARTHARRARSG
jgi:hypothetical protein